MKVKGRFDHFNIDVTNLEQSIRFYETALGLHEANRKVAADGSFILVYMADDHSNFLLELTWLRDHPQPYELGCVCYENTEMGLYFINDPDDYWIEVLPVK